MNDTILMPDETLAQRIRDLGQDYFKFAEKLSAPQSVKGAFPEVFENLEPSPFLHVLVQLPTSSKWHYVNSRYRSTNPILLLTLSLADNVFIILCSATCHVV